ncbi:NAD(P)-binding protein [Pyrenochaeta sp. DS3sAY3a]|nr:NAD(P)-binding protein [Pyrenochaeta sp. DS3sAY3a]
MAPQVAIVTGAASGIGLAVAEHLVQKGWNVAITDVNEKAGELLAGKLGKQSIFVRCDVTSYEQQSKVFEKTWKKWGRLDLVHANAGIADRVDFYAPQDEIADCAPPKPDSLVVDIDLYGAIWSSYLSLHYFRKENSSNRKKLIITASSAGIYPLGEAILYTAAKHGAVGLTRALGRRIKSEKLPITVNCLCPGMVPTNIISSDMVKAFPKEMITEMSVIIEAVDMVLGDDLLNGAAIECNGEQIQVRDQAPFLNDAAKFTGGGGYTDVIDMDDFVKHSEMKGKMM